MTVVQRCLAILIASLLLASCASEIKELPKTTTFNTESEDALLMVGLRADAIWSITQDENSMIWWAYDEETNQFADRAHDFIVVGRSKYDGWGWGGAGMHKQKYVLVRATPGPYVLHEIRLQKWAYRIAFNTYRIDLKGGVINYLGDYILFDQQMDEDIDYITSRAYQYSFDFDYFGHDVKAAEEAILKYPNIDAEMHLIEPQKIRLD